MSLAIPERFVAEAIDADSNFQAYRKGFDRYDDACKQIDVMSKSNEWSEREMGRRLILLVSDNTNGRELVRLYNVADWSY